MAVLLFLAFALARKDAQPAHQTVVSNPWPQTSDNECPVSPDAGRAAIRSILMMSEVPKLSPEMGLERQVSSITPYLAGLVDGIRATDRRAFRALGKELADRACSLQKTDLDLMVFAKLAVLEPELGTSRAIQCALDGRTGEDIVLWSVLDAWNAAGREPIPVLASIERSAVDSRTRWRLSKEQGRELRRQKINEMERGAR